MRTDIWRLDFLIYLNLSDLYSYLYTFKENEGDSELVVRRKFFWMGCREARVAKRFKARFPLTYFAAAGEKFRQQNTLLVVLWLHKQKVK